MSLFLSTDDLAQMRADVERMLPDTAVIKAVTRTSDGAGGWSESWSPVTGGTVACRLDPMTKSERWAARAGQEMLAVQYQLTVPYDAPLAADRQVVVGGSVYEVVQMDVDHSWNVSKRATVREVR